MNTKMGKIVKMSKILDAFLKIGAIVLIMFVVLAMLMIFTVPSLDVVKFESGFLSFSGLWGNSSFIGNTEGLQAAMILGMLNSGVAAAILFVASFIFKGISCERTPFTQKNSKRLKIISLLLVALGAVVPPLQMLLVLVFINHAAEIYFSINIGHFVFAAMFYCLALIFEYGAELQRESDETL